ncbi:MAG: hypothetical protein EBR09_16615 [Proteobacteria bacterium]|nr:hypothetical protein [Pseudomonadota bacterium]
MNNQEAFEMAVKHLRKQGCCSQRVGRFELEGTATCMYRMNGLKCAIGALIPDEVYQESFEGTGIRILLRTEPTINELFKKVNTNLLENLQEVHDNREVKEWEESLEKLAEFYGLTMPSKEE